MKSENHNGKEKPHLVDDLFLMNLMVLIYTILFGTVGFTTFVTNRRVGVENTKN